MKLSDRDIQTIREYAKLAGEDDEIVEMIMAANFAGNDKAFHRMRDFLLHKAAPQMMNPDPFYPYPKQEDFHGDLELGNTKSAVWKIKSDVLCTHMLGTGATGAGKTTQAFDAMEKLHHRDKRILSLGVKQDARHIACNRVPMLVLRCSQNPNFSLGDIFKAPEGVNEVDYQSAVIKCFAQSTFIAEAGESLLIEVVTTVRAKEGYVSLHNLINHLKRMKCWSARMNDWKSTSLNRLTAFNIRFGPMFIDQHPFPFEKVLEKRNIELELDGAGAFKSFFAALPLLRLFMYRIANNIRPKQLNIAIFCDEVNILASKTIERHAAALGSLPMMLEYMPLCREFGLGDILYSNQPSEVSNVLKAQAGIKMSMRLGHWQDIVDIGNSMTLDKEQMKAIIDLPPGHAIVKMQGLKPFPVKIPNFEVEKNVTDEEINENNRKLLEGSEWESFLVSNTSSNTMVIPLGDMNALEEIDELMRSFLFDVYNRSAVGLTERFKSLGLSIRRGNQFTELMNNRRFINVHEINLSGRGGKTKFLELTKKGHDAIGVTPKKKYGKGCGFLHELIQHKVAKHVRSIVEIKKVSIEGMLLDKSIDILVDVIDGKKIGIEIAMTAAHELDNIHKDIKADCDYIIVACRDKKVEEEVDNLIADISKQEKSRVMICQVYQLLKCSTLGDIFSLKK